MSDNPQYPGGDDFREKWYTPFDWAVSRRVDAGERVPNRDMTEFHLNQLKYGFLESLDTDRSDEVSRWFEHADPTEIMALYRQFCEHYEQHAMQFMKDQMPPGKIH